MEERKQPTNRSRKKRSRADQFKENYLPALIICVAFILILVFTIGSITRSFQHNKAEQLRKEQVRLSAQQAKELLDKEAQELIDAAKESAADYDFLGAIQILDSFSGDVNEYEQITQLRQQYETEQESLVLWEDNSQVLNLSFQHLIADPARAFSEENGASYYKYHYITTTEFSNILMQLYQNDYILISLDDIYSKETDELGQTYMSAKQLYLPAGKKPVIITQTQVNYYIDMVDGNGDLLPDKDGHGFANKLLVDENGNISCEIVNSDGTVSTGAYDLVPILDSFITTHPDFSYRGAKAILAVTGYEGLFGYRTTMQDNQQFPANYAAEETEKALNIISALRASGYDIACYTYGNIPYGDNEIGAINADMSGWITNILPILGDIDIFVFARTSDISSPSTIYIGEKYNKLASMGFKYYIGFCEDGAPWQMITDSYVRQGRLLVTGNNLENNQEWFTEFFDPATVLDSSRNS